MMLCSLPPNAIIIFYHNCERASFDINNNLELPLIDISFWMIFIINSFVCLIMNLFRVMCCVLISGKAEYIVSNVSTDNYQFISGNIIIVYHIAFKFLLLILS